MFLPSVSLVGGGVGVGRVGCTRLCSVPDDVSEGSFCYFPGGAGFGAPVLETGAEPVGYAVDVVFFEEFGQPVAALDLAPNRREDGFPAACVRACFVQVDLLLERVVVDLGRDSRSRSCVWWAIRERQSRHRRSGPRACPLAKEVPAGTGTATERQQQRSPRRSDTPPPARFATAHMIRELLSIGMMLFLFILPGEIYYAVKRSK